MVSQAHHQGYQALTVRLKLIERLNKGLLKLSEQLNVQETYLPS